MENCLEVFFCFSSLLRFLLFLPYMGMITSFFSNYFLPSTSLSGAVANQVNSPLGFGLTYWSLYLLNRLINLPITSAFVSFVDCFDWVCVCCIGVCLLANEQNEFSKPTYDLALVMLLPVLALFLTYRIICEQFFIWALPFLVILCIGGQVKASYYWGIR